MNIVQANVNSKESCVAIAVARFNCFVNKNLLEGAIDTLKRIGQIDENNITVVWVPGTYELPLTINSLAKTGKYNAIISLGTIIRGDTSHFKYIANSVSHSLMQLSLKFEIPIIFGILTTENIKQAVNRAGIKAGNKGAEVALSALEMINVLKAIKN